MAASSCCAPQCPSRLWKGGSPSRRGQDACAAPPPRPRAHWRLLTLWPFFFLPFPTGKISKCSWLGNLELHFLSPAWEGRGRQPPAEAGHIPELPCSLSLPCSMPVPGQKGLRWLAGSVSSGPGELFLPRAREWDTGVSSYSPVYLLGGLPQAWMELSPSSERLRVRDLNPLRLPASYPRSRWGIKAEIAGDFLVSGRARRQTQVGLTPKLRFLPPHPLACLCSGFLKLHVNNSVCISSARPGSWQGPGVSE